MIKIEINPNLRIDGDKTMVDLDEDVYSDGKPLGIFETVEVFESTSGLVGRGWVTEIGEAERTVTVTVDWANLKLPEGNQTHRPLHSSETNFTQALPPVPQVA